MAKAYNRYSTIKYIIDAPLVGMSCFLALYISLNSAVFFSGIYYIFALITMAVWYIAASFARLYADRRSDKFSEEIVFIVYAIILFTILLSSVSFFLKDFIKVNTYFFLVFTSSLLLLLTVTKYSIRKYVHAGIYRGKLFDNVLVVGATASAYDFYETINRYYYYGYKCVGFLDNNTARLNGCAYLGKVNNLARVLAEKNIDEVIIALPNSQNQQIQECLQVCDYYATKARIIPDLYQYASSSIQVNNIGMFPIMNVRPLPLDKSTNKLVKRLFDIFFSLGFFILLGWWLLPIIAVLIKLTSKGPVIFKQERWGLNNNRIVCYKFRTMVNGGADVNEKGIYRQATKDDARVTWLGRYLRKTNLDELPQFWNVLLGNMSVVGPRPHPTPLNLESMHTVENYMLRHVVKPGISGWAQVNGCRGETKIPGSMQQRVNYDLYYIHRWTFWLDIQIILQTVINFIRGDQNAY